MLVPAHLRGTDAIRESAPEADSGRTIPCRTGDSNPRQYCAWPFSQMLYPWSHPCSKPASYPMRLHMEVESAALGEGLAALLANKRPLP